MPNLPHQTFPLYGIFTITLRSESDKGDDEEDMVETNLSDEISEPQMEVDTGDVNVIDGSK